MILKQKKILKSAAAVLFILLSVFGCILCKDYGVSWDEPIERENGMNSIGAAYCFFTGDSLGRNLKWTDRYYGNGLQHLLVGTDCLKGCFGTAPDAACWYLRHALTFAFVLIGLFFMYRTGCLLWRNKLKAILPVILFLFIPRFAAESFYNIKDMGLLAGMMAGGYFMVRYALHSTCVNALLFGTAAAFVCSIRLVGLQLAAAGIFIALFMETLCKGKGNASRTLRQLLCILISFAVFLILLYPACWNSELIYFFGDAAAYMTAHPWGGTVRFLGRDLLSVNTPWYYLIVWIGVTTPLPIIFLLLTGSVCVLKKCFSGSEKFPRRRSVILLLMFFMMFWGELLLLPFIVKNCYNGWRHFYFLGYPMLILAGCGAVNLFKLAAKHRLGELCAIGAAVIAAGLHIFWMISCHPYQYMYFNILAGNPENFELDYWHVSKRDAVRRILEKNAGNSGTITLPYHDTIHSVLTMFGEKERKKFRISHHTFHNYVVIINDSDWSIEKHLKQYPQQTGSKIVSDETVWVKNSLGTAQGMLYRIVEFSKQTQMPDQSRQLNVNSEIRKL